MTDNKVFSNVQIRSVKDKDDGIRLDKWFKLYFPNLKFGHLQKLMRSGQIRIDSKRVKGSTRIITGQNIRIPPLDSEASDLNRNKSSVNKYKITDDERDELEAMMIFDNNHMMAVNKPEGLSVQGGSKQRRHLDGMLTAYAAEHDQGRPHLVHRLDKDTSGVLLLAKDESAARKIGKFFKEREMHKYYWALCLGKPEYESGEITAPLSKQKIADYGEYMRVDDEEGKFAKTYYHVIEQIGKKMCWVAFKPVTGRTHQIRVHASLIGCPIIGEDKYADEEEKEKFMEVLSDRKKIKLHLHARQLIMDNPFKGSGKGNDKINISASLPEHMLQSWKYLELDEKQANHEEYFSDL